MVYRASIMAELHCLIIILVSSSFSSGNVIDNKGVLSSSASFSHSSADSTCFANRVVNGKSGHIPCRFGAAWKYGGKQNKLNFDDGTLRNYEVSESSEECTPGQSLVSREDVIDIINFFESKLNISATIEKVHFPIAVAVRETHLHSLREIQSRILDRPVHLMDILNDIEFDYFNLEPLVNELAAKLQQHSVYEKKYSEAYERVQKLLELLEKYKQLCELNNCGEMVKTLLEQQIQRQYVSPSDAIDNEEYACVSFKNLSDRINTALTNALDAYHQEMLSTIDNDDIMYDIEIGSIWNNTKEKALVMFGKTMYNVLNLEDEYLRFEYNVKQNNVDSELNAINKNILEVELKLMDLENGVEEYHQYCLHCNPKARSGLGKLFETVLRQPRRTNNDITYIDKKTESSETDNSEVIDAATVGMKYLDVDKLIQNKVREIHQVTSNNYRMLYEELNNKINDPNVINGMLEKLKPMKDDLGIELMKHYDDLTRLENKISKDLIEKISDLSKKSKLLLEDVNAALDFIH